MKEITNPAFRATHDYIIEIIQEIFLDDAEASLTPMVHVMIYKNKVLRPLEVIAIDSKGLASGDDKNHLAKFLRSKRADHPLCVVAFVSEVWMKKVATEEELHEYDATGISEAPDKTEGLMFCMYHDKESQVVMHEILRNPKRFGKRHVLDAGSGRFA